MPKPPRKKPHDPAPAAPAPSPSPESPLPDAREGMPPAVAVFAGLMAKHAPQFGPPIKMPLGAPQTEPSSSLAPRTAPPAPITLPPEPPDPAADVEWQRNFFMERRLDAARIPRRFWKKTLENFDTKLPGTNRADPLRAGLAMVAREFVRRFSAESGGDYPKGLLFTGTAGCGKSHLASAILRAVVLEGHTGLFYNSPDLLMDIRATFESDSRIHESELLDMVDEVDLLVLDDLGAEKVTDFVLDRFYLVINRRYEGCKPIIVTSNYAPDVLAGRLGERVVSRLFEMCTPIADFPREDFRRRSVDAMMEIGRR